MGQSEDRQPRRERATGPGRRVDKVAEMGQSGDRLVQAFDLLLPDERQLLTAALAGNHPAALDDLRVPVLRALAKADLRHEGGVYVREEYR
jgi:hypothetical protein